MNRKSIVEIPVEDRDDASTVLTQIISLESRLDLRESFQRDGLFSYQATHEGKVWKTAFLGQGNCEDKVFVEPVLQIYTLADDIPAAEELKKSILNEVGLTREVVSHRSPTFHKRTLDQKEGLET